MNRTLPLGLAASFAPNRPVSADLTAFFSSRWLSIFFSMMAALMTTYPATAGYLAHLATMLESASAIRVNLVRSQNGGFT